MTQWGQGSSGEGEERQAWKVIEKVMLESVHERRRARRWGIFFKSLTFVYLFILIGLLMPSDVSENVKRKPHTAMVDVYGVIADDSDANAEAIIEGLEAAFEAPSSKAVVLRINSPGGSPVQSAYVYDAIRELRGKHPNKKVYAVITDIGASGAYYMAAAADQIYVNPASLVGSIGVIMNGFGFQDAMKKLGVERRVMTAGEHKAMLDPFGPIKPEEQAHVQAMLDNIHQQFISAVKTGRGNRLKQDTNTFSGIVWTGEQAVQNGLADGFGSLESVATKVVGAEEVVDYTPMKNPFENALKRMGLAAGTAMARQFQMGVGYHLE